MSKKMGYQGLLYRGTKGSTAATQITGRVDCTYDIDPEIGNTTAAGDGSTVPIVTGEATGLNAKLSFNMLQDNNDTSLVALKAAAATGNPIALKFIPFSGGTGLDADCVVKVSQGSPRNGEATADIEVVALSDALRAPSLNV